MNINVDIGIERPKKDVWLAITDIKNASNMISGIIDLEVLNQPVKELIGLKWKETRMMFGKEASEVMWITEAVENEYFCTRAESHGSVYRTKLSLEESEGVTVLTMSFIAEAQSLIVKMLSVFMGALIKNSMNKALQKDLEDIKRYVEQS